jgi:hypothetical protein
LADAPRSLAWLAIAGSLGAVVPLPAAEARRDPRPNLLFILLEDLGKEWVSAYGAEDIRTPHLDAGGTRFEKTPTGSLRAGYSQAWETEV